MLTTVSSQSTDSSDVIPGQCPTVPTTTYNNFLDPLDSIYAIVKQLYESKRYMRLPDMEKVSAHVQAMKSNIVNVLVPALINHSNIAPQAHDPLATGSPAPPSQPRQTVNKNTEVITKKPSYSEVAKKQRSAVIIKSGNNVKPDKGMLSSVEESVSHVLKSKNIDATIHSTVPGKNGEVVMLFDEKDDVNRIAKDVTTELGVETHWRSLILPKVTISHIPSYIQPCDLKDTLLTSNAWLKELAKDNTFEVLFTYKVKDHISAVFKVSPRVRSAIIDNENKVRVGVRACPVKDRLHARQCRTCCKFTHRSSECNESPKCGFCSLDHAAKDCPDQSNTEKHRCTNCTNESDDSDSSHSAFSNRCPALHRKLNQVIHATNWGNSRMPKLD